jgi:pyruvate kinase
MPFDDSSWESLRESQRLEWLAGCLTVLLEEMRAVEQQLGPRLEAVDSAWRSSAINLAHYLALRRHDVRPLQARLAETGLSSLGRSEPHARSTVAAVLQVVERLRAPLVSGSLPAVDEHSDLLPHHTEELFGAPRPGRRVHIMVTMPSEAATSPELVHALVENGMDVMRINCAHDDATAWRAMVRHLRDANEALGARCRIQFDLPGPKLRTGEFVAGEAVLHLSPTRDERGSVVVPARVRFTADDSPGVQGDAVLRVPSTWLSHAAVGRVVRLTDLRGKERVISLLGRDARSAWGDCARAAWIGPETSFCLDVDDRTFRCEPVGLPAKSGSIHLSIGDRLRLVGPDRKGRGPTADEVAIVPCTLPEVLPALQEGHRVFLDDGKLGGVVEERRAGGVTIRLTQAPPTGARLSADKGINLPDTHLDLPALGLVDLEALDVAVELGDLVALSFARSADDVLSLHAALEARGGRRLGVVLKVENREGFENLSALLLAAMRRPPFGVMIARGDLAVECGFARLAELQEEILCLCEAAHAPVVWATQVLETAARKGFPSRAEVTDAAMGERAECVMLNKGPFIVEALRTLDDILRRMESHQRKKTPLFRRLRSLGLE